jgi:hypothetical protein
MFDEKTCSLIVPRVSGPPALLSIRKIYETECRIREVATVNAQKAPELLAVLNVTYLEINDLLGQLELLAYEAQKALSSRQAIVLLDIAPGILESRGLKTSVDLRDAILNQDSGYVECQDRIAQIKAVTSLLEGKREGIVMAYTSIKKIFGNSNDWRDLNRNRNLSAGAPERPDSVAANTTDDGKNFGG